MAAGVGCSEAASLFAVVLWGSVRALLALGARSGGCCQSRSTSYVDKVLPGRHRTLSFIAGVHQRGQAGKCSPPHSGSAEDPVIC